MSVHRLEIEVTDSVLSWIDRVSARTGHSRAEVVAEKLEEQASGEEISKEQRLEAFRRSWDVVSKLGPGRSQAEIDRQVREFREDRNYDR